MHLIAVVLVVYIVLRSGGGLTSSAKSASCSAP